MRVLFYTQAPYLGGAFRLLLNVANRLSRACNVSFATSRAMEPDARRLIEIHPWITETTISHVATESTRFDVLVAHLPFDWEDFEALPIRRKIGVLMEFPENLPSPIGDRQAKSFDLLVHLADCQVAHLEPQVRARLCRRLPVVNDVDFEPRFVRTGRVGCVGSPWKHSPTTLIKVLNATRGMDTMVVYAGPKKKLAARRLNLMDRMKIRYHILRGNLAIKGSNLNIAGIFESFDCLLHTPDISFGSSMVVNDALACGRPVALSDIPGHREAFGGMEGVHFVDELNFDLGSVLSGYDKNQFMRILECYSDRYQRDLVLQAWEEAVLGA